MCNPHVKRLAAALLTFGPGLLPAVEPRPLPVFFSDNHAESFGWIAQNFPLDEPHLLLLIDAHSDASAVNHSDIIREGLRRVVSVEARTERITDWRASGRIQAYNWIEALMPKPISEVIWVAACELATGKRENLTMESMDQLDARLEFEARETGTLAARWRVFDLRMLESWSPPELPVIASVDLDFFHGLSPAEAASAFERVWSVIMGVPRLAGISFAVSRPWLTNDAEAERLLLMAMTAAGDLENAEISIARDEVSGPDNSLKAGEFRSSNTPIPRFNWKETGPAVGNKLSLLTQSDSPEKIQLEVDDAVESVDRIWRLTVGSPVVLRVKPGNQQITGRSRWFLLEPGSAAFDLLPETGLGKSFSPAGTGSAVWQRRKYLGETGDGAWPLQLPDGPSAWGRWRVVAEVETEQGWKETSLLELRVQDGTGFHRALTGQFRSPYVFGIGLAREGNLTGPDTAWGYDCANFLIAAWRETGLWLPWGDPGALRKHLVTLAEGLDLKSAIPMETDTIKPGLVMDFGSHMAALWEDREPLESLGPEDIAVHHLGGFPELIGMDQLTDARGKFALRILDRTSAARIWFGGDVVLDERPPDLSVFDIPKGDSVVVNLEGIAVKTARAIPGRYRFVFPIAHLAQLREAGVKAISLANNHSGDAGTQGLAECIEAASSLGFQVAGLPGKSGVSICDHPKIVLLAASLFEDRENPHSIFTLPKDAKGIEKQMSELRNSGASVVVMLHGGDEYSSKANAEQQHWSRWFIDRGAVLVVWSHAHVLQPLEAYRGRPIAFSLGNLIYPQELQGADSGAWLRVDFSASGDVVESDLIPVHLNR